ncbi:uncharacterized protein RCC_08443 [Ramularia collo-cygni]|uniref:GPI anchored protein n=1 Tax=Ramularia collo-cygni TaxID=112498 RepID=A0A2D3VMD3_9PEZI|nr:uncharacterized protein RCC_08443 [Ramularia collo-cygni]CZT22738.1 uncharacterized protein RCC_08443 [Ramularia collo-cygni]
MQYQILALAFAATASAQTDLASVVSVLATALPSSLISEYATNSAAVASEISSAFDAGNTPSWFEALPSAVQTYLIPVDDSANVTGTLLSSSSSMVSSSLISGAPTVIVSPTGNSTLATTRRNPTATRTTSSSDSENTDSSSGDDSSSSDSSSETSSGGASVPTAIMGMGFAGAAGLVGLLAL